MRIWITSDTHFAHIAALRWRPSDYEKRIKRHLMNSVKEGDMLIHLGDVSLGKDIINHNWFREALKCRTILVIGNHDSRSSGWYMRNGWDFACQTFSLKYGGLRLLFSHIPQMYDLELYDLNVHGHLHENRHRGDITPFLFHDRKYSLISLEFSDYKPTTLDTIIKTYERQNSQKAKEILDQGKECLHQAAIPLKTEISPALCLELDI